MSSSASSRARPPAPRGLAPLCASLAVVLALGACGGGLPGDLVGVVPPGGSTTGGSTTGGTTLSIEGGNNQTVLVGTVAATALTVRVVDPSGVPLPGVVVSWAVTSGNGIVSPSTTTTDQNGVAIATFTAGPTPGTATITASVGSGPVARFTVTISSTAGAVCGGAATTTSGRVACFVAAFATTLSATELATAQLPLTEANLTRWSALPCGGSCRNGIALGALTSTQRAAALEAIRAAMSAEGFATFQAVRAADSVLAEEESEFGAGNYYVAWLGTPSETGTWTLQVGGNHYAATISFAGGAPVSFTPYFVGAEPQTVVVGGTAFTPLLARRNAAYALLESLDGQQRVAAQLKRTFDDVLLGPGEDDFPAPQGLLVSSLSAPQQALVTAAIAAWLRDAPPELAARLLAEYTTPAAYAATRVAWSGSTDSTVAGSYVRIDGPAVWIELVARPGEVFPAQIHYHTIWRDRTRDYGGL